MIDIIDTISKSDSYRDFEGFVDGSDVLKCCIGDDGKYIWENFIHFTSHVPREVLRAIVLNIVSEAIDMGDTPTPREVMWICHTAHELLSVRRWTEVTDDEVAALTT